MKKEIHNAPIGCFGSGFILFGIVTVFSISYEVTSNSLISLALAIFMSGLFFNLQRDLTAVKSKNMLLINDVDELSGEEFEKFLVTLFQDMGHSAWKTKANGDFGIDVLVQFEGKLIAIQAKRSKSNIGVKALYEAVGGEAYYKADEAWVVTNSNFTAQAWTYARKTNGVKLIDRVELSRLIKDRNTIVQRKLAEEERRKSRK